MKKQKSIFEEGIAKVRQNSTHNINKQNVFFNKLQKEDKNQKEDIMFNFRRSYQR